MEMTHEEIVAILRSNGIAEHLIPHEIIAVGVACYQAGARAEREACADLCISLAVDDLGNIGGQCYDCADAIRARTNP